MRALPIAVLRPVAGAAEAISYALLGEEDRRNDRRRRNVFIPSLISLSSSLLFFVLSFFLFSSLLFKSLTFSYPLLPYPPFSLLPFASLLLSPCCNPRHAKQLGPRLKERRGGYLELGLRYPPSPQDKGV